MLDFPRRLSVLLVLASPCLPGQSLTTLPPEPAVSRTAPDWLLNAAPYRAGVYRSADGKELVLTNGLLRRAFRIAPNCATVALDCLPNGTSMLRGVKPEAELVLDGKRYPIGGLSGQPNYAYLDPAWLDRMVSIPDGFRFRSFAVTAPKAPFAWKRTRHHDAGAAWPPAGAGLRFDYGHPQLPGVEVAVHYEIYDGIPACAKWLTVTNGGQQPFTVDRFTSELLALVEPESRVESRSEVPFRTPNVWVETDYAAGGSNENAMRFSVHWLEDPAFHTQVNYLRKQPCLLACRPQRGPAQVVPPGGTFRSFRSFVLLHDSWDRGRNGLARRKLYRTIAPWTTENPLMMHVRSAAPDAVRKAIDQCAAVGFEMVILTFGSGFNIENEDPAYLDQLKGLADYAGKKGIELGGYSLLSSRKIGNGQDIVPPAGEQVTHGNCPALTSEWGQDYFRKLKAFFPRTGFSLLEHDGPYPGDVDVTARPPLQRGVDDSRWVQFWISAGFYRWCRGQGIYLNTPDWYYLNGSTKCAMGYREVNWSLPRAQQVIHTRQNVFDGTWTKTPTMGWMFVPLTQYHGGGAAATVEPLAEHLDHYRRILESNLAAGVQACYRGPRLFDTEATKAMVQAQVAWFKRHRRILEGDIIHQGSRRADGRGLDWLLHVRPGEATAGLLAVFNPTDRTVRETILTDVYYTGLRQRAVVRDALLAPVSDPTPERLTIDHRGRLRIEVEIPAGAMRAFTLAAQ